MSAPKLYPYNRYSDSRQTGNTSIERQSALIQQIADDLNLPVGEAFIDSGVSGYKGDNTKDGGALFDFIFKVEQGLIPKGSVLAIESWDRFSRENFMRPLKRLLDLLDLEIKVAVGSGNSYQLFEVDVNKDETAEFLGFSNLLVAQMEMFRAWSESKRKSELQKASYVQTVAGHNRGGSSRKIPGDCPKWIISTKDGFELHEHAQNLKYAVELYLNGIGFNQVARRLIDESKVCFWANGWSDSSLKKAFSNVALMGDREVSTDDGIKTAESYYPALISKHRFIELQQAIERRKGKQGQQLHISTVTGSGWLKCGLCGSGLTSQTQVCETLSYKGNYKPFRLGDRDVAYSNVNCMNKKGCFCGVTRTVTIEKILIDYCSDKANMSFLNNRNPELEELIYTKSKELEEVSNGISNLSKAIAKVGFTDELDKNLSMLVDSKSSIQSDLTALKERKRSSTNITGDLLSQMAEIYDQNTDESRSKVAEIFNATFNQVWLINYKQRAKDWYHTVKSPFGDKRDVKIKKVIESYPLSVELTEEVRLPTKDEILVIIEFKAGTKRALYCDRSGNWDQVYDYELDQWFTRLDNQIAIT